MLSSDLNDLWQKALSIIEKQVTGPSFETWLKPTKLIRFDNNTMAIEVPNAFAKDWLEARYYELIKKSLEEETNRELGIAFVVPDSGKPSSERCTTGTEDIFSTNLNPKYTFDTFVVGDSNRFAHSAALAAAESPAKSYNPLFVYGGVGLGKTHLIQAIGHHVLKNNPDAKVFYASSEKFTYELINSIRDNRIAKFWSKYRNVDVLLIDDIHFLAGKERTQEEFFHTFNALYEANKQIIISSAKYPKQIPSLEESLCSRFEGGLVIDIQPPDLETRIAILKKRVESEQLQVPSDVITCIAEQFHSNIRELEGALTRVILYSSVQESQITGQMKEFACGEFHS